MNAADVTQPCSILVVDDDAEMASTLQEFLQKEGYIAEVAHSAAEAIALLERGPHVSLALVDLIIGKTEYPAKPSEQWSDRDRQ